LTTLGAKFDAVFKDEKLPPANEAAFHAVEQTLINHRWAFAYLAPRGIGPSQWSAEGAKLTHLKRSFILLGQTHDGMCAYDVHAAIGALGKVKSVQDRPLWLQSQRQMAGVTLAAAAFHPEIKRLDLHDLPSSLRQGPYFMNIQRYLDTPELVALVAENSQVVLYQDDTTGWEYPQRVGEKLGWDKKQFQLRAKPKAE
ncbi:MAG TPA: hypothetical protein VL096_21135, partial [Pirellulaceae bacterium]|nr:hypothetical protein [Pirellulaceae bacterium]